LPRASLVTASDEQGRALQCKYLKFRQFQEKTVSRAAAYEAMQGEQRKLPVSNITAGSGSWMGKILQLQSYLEGRDF